MYKEINRRKNNIVAVIGMFALCAAGAVLLLKLLPVVQLVRDILLMAVLIGFVFVLIKKYLSEYEYELTDEELIFRTYLGGRVSYQVCAELGKLKAFYRAEDKKPMQNRVSRITMCTFSGKKYVALFEDEGKLLKIVFAPSEQLVCAIEDKIHFSEEE